MEQTISIDRGIALKMFLKNYYRGHGALLNLLRQFLGPVLALVASVLLSVDKSEDEGNLKVMLYAAALLLGLVLMFIPVFMVYTNKKNLQIGKLKIGVAEGQISFVYQNYVAEIPLQNLKVVAVASDVLRATSDGKGKFLIPRKMLNEELTLFFAERLKH